MHILMVANLPQELMTSFESITAILNFVKNTKFPKDPRFLDSDKYSIEYIIYRPMSAF